MGDIHEESITVRNFDYVVSWHGSNKRQVHISRRISVPQQISGSPDLIDECKAACGSGVMVNSAESGKHVCVLRVSVGPVDRENTAAFDSKIADVERACEQIVSLLNKKVDQKRGHP